MQNPHEKSPRKIESLLKMQVCFLNNIGPNLAQILSLRSYISWVTLLIFDVSMKHAS